MSGNTFASRLSHADLEKEREARKVRKKNHVTNKKDWERVVKLAACGLDKGTIADIIECDKDLILDRYEDAFQHGRTLAKEKVASKIYELCMAGDRTMLIFFAKVHLGWNERVELTGANGGPIQSQTVVLPDKKLSREEWMKTYSIPIDDKTEVVN